MVQPVRREVKHARVLLSSPEWGEHWSSLVWNEHWRPGPALYNPPLTHPSPRAIHSTSHNTWHSSTSDWIPARDDVEIDGIAEAKLPGIGFASNIPDGSTKPRFHPSTPSREEFIAWFTSSCQSGTCFWFASEDSVIDVLMKSCSRLCKLSWFCNLYRRNVESILLVFKPNAISFSLLTRT